MIFSVHFISKLGSAIHKPKSIPIGLNDVYQIRQDLHLPDFDIKNIRDSIPNVEIDPKIEITERIAKHSGLFYKKNYVRIKVGQGSLNNHLQRKICFQKTEDGEIIEAWIEHSIDNLKIIQKWSKAQFPMIWELSIEEEEEEENRWFNMYKKTSDIYM